MNNISEIKDNPVSDYAGRDQYVDRRIDGPTEAYQNTTDFGAYKNLYQWWNKVQITGLILVLCPANDRHCYKVTPSLIGWAQT